MEYIIPAIQINIICKDKISLTILWDLEKFPTFLNKVEKPSNYLCESGRAGTAIRCAFEQLKWIKFQN